MLNMKVILKSLKKDIESRTLPKENVNDKLADLLKKLNQRYSNDLIKIERFILKHCGLSLEKNCNVYMEARIIFLVKALSEILYSTTEQVSKEFSELYNVDQKIVEDKFITSVVKQFLDDVFGSMPGMEIRNISCATKEQVDDLKNILKSKMDAINKENEKKSQYVV